MEDEDFNWKNIVNARTAVPVNSDRASLETDKFSPPSPLEPRLVDNVPLFVGFTGEHQWILSFDFRRATDRIHSAR